MCTMKGNHYFTKHSLCEIIIRGLFCSLGFASPCNSTESDTEIQVQSIVLALGFGLEPSFTLLCSFILFYLFISRERGREGERKGEKHVCLPLARPQPGTQPTTLAYALTGN